MLLVISTFQLGYYHEFKQKSMPFKVAFGVNAYYVLNEQFTIQFDTLHMSQNQLLQLKVNALLQKELQKIFNARKTGEDETALIKILNSSEEAKEPKSVQIIQLSERDKQYIVQYI
ncbi:Hypothetical_protein [Hexamita inflata]|uniref:Hypothetical_protein n=1 Tax=Hexamita inflata TaxID=28002 RepID=A0AA86NL85_9EUKA|nr:Hypothetical protein HINF_LOCUS8810 [Hexamita inflata]